MEEIETLESWVSRVCECDQENAEKVKATFMRFCITSGVPEDKLEELKKAVKDSDETEGASYCYNLYSLQDKF